MLKKSFCLLLAAGACFAAAAGEIVIADGEKSGYQIVVPDPAGNRALDDYVALGGKVIRTAVKKASGAEVPLVTESKKIPGKPAIYVGNVKALAKAMKKALRVDTVFIPRPSEPTTQVKELP